MCLPQLVLLIWAKLQLQLHRRVAVLSIQRDLHDCTQASSLSWVRVWTMQFHQKKAIFSWTQYQLTQGQYMVICTSRHMLRGLSGRQCTKD